VAGYAAQASLPEAVQAAMDVLPAGNAVDAVIAGVLAAAALVPTVLLGPVQLLLGGAGVGERAVDGRPRQPGRGAQRPRGFLPGQDVPRAARVAVPALPAALAAAQATAGLLTWSRVMGPAVELAKERSDERRKFLKRLGQAGPSYLADAPVSTELLAVAGRVEGGLLTQEDLSEVLPVIVPAPLRRDRGVPLVTVPWGAEAIDGDERPFVDGSAIGAVAAADTRGLVAIAVYEAQPYGLPIPELGLEAPFFAAPVLRGETRVKPGDVRPTAAPIALLQVDGVLDTALGVTGASCSERLLGRVIRAIGQGSSLEDAIAAPRGGGDEGYALGVVRSKRGVRAFGDPRRAGMPTRSA
jgi:gamma-glutamyltranspeptidase